MTPTAFSATPLRPHYPITASSPIILPSVREPLAPPGSLDSLLINISVLHLLLLFPLVGNITLSTSSAPLRLTIRTHSSVVNERERQMEKGDEKRYREQSFAFMREVNSVRHTAKRKLYPSFTVLLTHLLTFIWRTIQQHLQMPDLDLATAV